MTALETAGRAGASCKISMCRRACRSACPRPCPRAATTTSTPEMYAPLSHHFHLHAPWKSLAHVPACTSYATEMSHFRCGSHCTRSCVVSIVVAEERDRGGKRWERGKRPRQQLCGSATDFSPPSGPGCYAYRCWVYVAGCRLPRRRASTWRAAWATSRRIQTRCWTTTGGTIHRRAPGRSAMGCRRDSQ